MLLPITTMLASGVALWLAVLSVAVILARRSAGVSLGDGGDPGLGRRIRAQANLAEYAPTALILVGLGEAQGAAAWALSALSALFFAARLSHGIALAFTASSPPLRLFGAAGTLTALIILALVNLGLLVAG